MDLNGSQSALIMNNTYHSLSWSATKIPSSNSFKITATLSLKRTDSSKSYGNCSATIQIGSSSSGSIAKYIEIGGSAGKDYVTVGSFTDTFKADSSGALVLTIKSKISDMPGTELDKASDTQKTLSYSIYPDPIGHYTVKYYANGGEGAPDPQTKIEGISLKTSTKKPTRTGYRFTEWEYSITTPVGGIVGSGPSGFVYTHDFPVSLYAVWEPIRYYVNFNGNGGTSSEDPRYLMIYDQSKVLRQNFYTKTGHAFSHWNTDPNGSGNHYSGGQTVKNLSEIDGSTVTLYAQWEPMDFAVYLDSQGGSGGISKVYYMYGYPVPPLYQNISNQLPTKSGYRFSGYYSGTNGSGTQFYNSSGISTYSGNWPNANEVTIYAYWILDTITVSFDPRGGSCSYSSKTVYPNGTYGDLPSASYYGKLFNGWCTSDWSSVTSTTPVKYNFDHTLQADWRNDYAYIYFDAMGGSCSTSSMRVDYGYSYGTLPVPTRSGYQFDGWYTSTSGGSLVTSSTTNWSISSVTVYARWTSIVYTITFDANGGTCDTTTKSVIYGSAYGTLPSPTKYGHRFSGWKYGGNFITSTTTMNVYSNHTLVAVYDVIQYTISLCDKNADTPFLTQIHEHGSEISEIKIPNREHYIYRGLFHDKACTNRVSPTDLITSDMTLYALFLEDGVLSIYLNGKLDNYYVYALENGEVVRRIPKFLHNGKIY